MRGDGLGCSIGSRTRSRFPISVRIAVLWFESRLGAFLWGIALSLQFALPTYTTREPRIRSSESTKVNLRNFGGPLLRRVQLALYPAHCSLGFHRIGAVATQALERARSLAIRR